MLDFGWPELFVIMAVAVLVIGPKEIPQLMYGLGKMMRRLQYMRYAVSSQFDDFMKEAELDEMREEAAIRTSGSSQAEKEADEEMAAEQDVQSQPDSPDLKAPEINANQKNKNNPVKNNGAEGENGRES